MVRLKYWRKKRNLTQLQLAALLGTSAGYVHEIETGKKLPSIKMLCRIAEVLDVCPKKLIFCICKRCRKCSKKALE